METLSGSCLIILKKSKMGIPIKSCILKKQCSVKYKVVIIPLELVIKVTSYSILLTMNES